MFVELVLFFLGNFPWNEAVPPEACFANFRHDDCGLSPIPVLYYWKPGSRCEVGFWRGCLPNINMFHDEYECVATCIFTARAEEVDFHNLNAIMESGEFTEGNNSAYDDNETTTDINTGNVTVADEAPANSTAVPGGPKADNSSEAAPPETEGGTTLPSGE